MAAKIPMTEMVRRHGYYDPALISGTVAKKAAAKEVEANKGDCQEGRSCRQGGTGEYTRIWHRVHDPSAAVSCPVGQRTLAHPLN